MYFLGILVGISSAIVLYDRFTGRETQVLKREAEENREAMRRCHKGY